MGQRDLTGSLARVQPAAPRSLIPKLGETWHPMGRKALVGTAYLVPVDAVRSLVPEEFEIVPVLPGRTVATVFVADYGPGSTLEYHEFGVQPGLVRFRGVTAAWNSLLLVDSPASVRGGELLGFKKQLADFDWQEGAGPGRRVSGQCTVRLQDQEVVRIRYRQGWLPLPSVPVRTVTLRDDMVLDCSNRLRGSYRWSTVIIEPSEEGPASYLRHFSHPLLTVVATKVQGAMANDVRVLGFLPHRNPVRIEVE
jgi:Acetoacetate decarboxylase (ADC)